MKIDRHTDSVEAWIDSCEILTDVEYYLRNKNMQIH